MLMIKFTDYKFKTLYFRNYTFKIIFGFGKTSISYTLNETKTFSILA